MCRKLLNGLCLGWGGVYAFILFTDVGVHRTGGLRIKCFRVRLILVVWVLCLVVVFSSFAFCG